MSNGADDDWLQSQAWNLSPRTQVKHKQKKRLDRHLDPEFFSTLVHNNEAIG